MKISEIFNLGKSQYELDFVNIDVNSDIQLFMDPYFLSNNNDVFSIKSSEIIRDFFQSFIDIARSGDYKKSEKLFYNLSEPNETCFGLSKNEPQGRGVGPNEALRLHKSLITSKALKTGLIEDIEDSKIFIRGIGRDKISDMVTNLIKRELIRYTQSQCKLWKIPMKSGVPSGYFWNMNESKWDNVYTDMLVVKNKKIILVPKGRVSFHDNYTPEKYYDDFVLKYFENENLQLNSVLVQRRKDGRKYITKKSLKEEYPYSKEFLMDFTKKHEDIFAEFKDKTIRLNKPLGNDFFEELNSEELINIMISKLRELPPGRDHASDYDLSPENQHSLKLSFLADKIGRRKEGKCQENATHRNR